MAIEFKTSNEWKNHINCNKGVDTKAMIDKTSITTKFYGSLNIPELEQILSKMKELQNEIQS